MTLYATGMRRAEVTALKIADIDSARMVLHVKEGKGGKDRDIVLSPRLLEELRQPDRRLGRKPAVWLFPGGTHPTADTPSTEKVGWHACRRAAQRCGVTASPSAHFEALFRDASAGGRHRPAHPPTPARPCRPARDDDLHPSVETP